MLVNRHAVRIEWADCDPARLKSRPIPPLVAARLLGSGEGSSAANAGSGCSRR
jgi:hypothetical protein